MMKRKLWRITSCVLTLCLLAVSLNFLMNLMERKYSIEKYQPFFEQEADFDVLFLGSSHTVNGVFPMELWNDYGIVSYNIGGYGNPIPTSYWVMENALDYTEPKLIVADCHALIQNHKTSSISVAHQSLDAFPLSATKINTVLDLLNDPEIPKEIENGTLVEAEKRTPIGLLWDFSVYHARWNELRENDFQVIAFSEKGADTQFPVTVPQDFPKIDPSEKQEEDTVGVEYLKRTIETCQGQGIDVLLIYLPFFADPYSQKEANRVYDIAAEYGVNYINFLDMDIVNYDTDMASGGHLNASGARKVTDYLGKYIRENYPISDQRGNPEYAGWFEDYEEYKVMKKRNLQKYQNSWDSYFMLLADKNLDAIIEVRNPELWNTDKFVNMVENLGIDMSGVPDAANYLIIRKGGLQAEAAALDTNADTQTDTAMGLLRISHDESGEYSVYLDDTACFVPGGENGGNIRVYVRDSETLETVGQAAF